MKYYDIYDLRSDDMYGNSMRIKVEKGINIELAENDEFDYWQLTLITPHTLSKEQKLMVDNEIDLNISFTAKAKETVS
jgi:hypothetical protein